MNQVTVRVFLSTGTPIPGQRGNVEELNSEHVEGEGDAAKSAANALLLGKGYTVRSLSWSPVAGGDDVLAAYVERK